MYFRYYCSTCNRTIVNIMKDIEKVNYNKKSVLCPFVNKSWHPMRYLYSPTSYAGHTRTLRKPWYYGNTRYISEEHSQIIFHLQLF